MALTRAAYPVAPPAMQRESTLLDVAHGESGSFDLHDGNGLYDSFHCMQFGQAADFCAPNVKDLDEQAPMWVDGIRFAAYGGVGCKAVGLDMKRMESEVARVFALGESAAVEQALMVQRFRDDTSPDNRWDPAVDLTPAGGAVSPKAGLAYLEDYAATVYVGTPVIHVPIAIGSLLLADVAEMQAGIVRSKLGSKIAVGAGYSMTNTSPAGVAAPAGEKWVYASGEVTYMNSEAIRHLAFEQTNNEVVVLAERAYIAAVECFTAAIRVKVE
jgi:hypothetical protein